MKKNTDLSVTYQHITPKDYKNLGIGLNLIYGLCKTPFGEVLLAFANQGITDLFFITATEDEAIKKLQKKWVKAFILRDDSKAEKVIEQIFYGKNKSPELNIFLIGTSFQIAVWKALLTISENRTCSYSDIAKIIDNPKATRAVGTAIGQNPIHYLIPCHRVIRKNGNIGGYAGGINIKEKILAWEGLLLKN